MRVQRVHVGILLALLSAAPVLRAQGQLQYPDSTRWQRLEAPERRAYAAIALASIAASPSGRETWNETMAGSGGNANGTIIFMERRAPERVGDRSLLWLLFDFDVTASPPPGEQNRTVARELSLMQFDCSRSQWVNVGLVLLDSHGDPLRRLTYTRESSREFWDYPGSTYTAIILQHACGAATR